MSCLRSPQLRTKVNGAVGGGKENLSKGGVREAQLPPGMRDTSPTSLTQGARSSAGGPAAGGAGAGAGAGGDAGRGAAGRAATAAPPRLNGTVPAANGAKAGAGASAGTVGAANGEVEAYLLPASDKCAPPCSAASRVLPAAFPLLSL